MSFTVPAKYRPGNFVLVHWTFEESDCLVLGIVESIDAHCTSEDSVSYGYTIQLSSNNKISVPEECIFYNLSSYDTLYHHELIESLRKLEGDIAKRLDRCETEMEEERKKYAKTPPRQPITGAVVPKS